MELESLPETLKTEVRIHLQDGYKLISYEDEKVTLMKKRRFRVGMFIINILTLRWLLYLSLPHLIVLDIIGIKYYLYIKENGGEFEITTG